MQGIQAHGAEALEEVIKLLGVPRQIQSGDEPEETITIPEVINGERLRKDYPQYKTSFS